MLIRATRVMEIGYLFGNLYSLWYLYQNWGAYGGLLLGFCLIYNVLLVGYAFLAMLFQLLTFSVHSLSPAEDGSATVNEATESWNLQREAGRYLGLVYPRTTSLLTAWRILCGLLAVIAGPLFVHYGYHLYVILLNEEGMAVALILPAMQVLLVSLLNWTFMWGVFNLFFPDRYLPLLRLLPCAGFIVSHQSEKKMVDERPDPDDEPELTVQDFRTLIAELRKNAA